MWTCPCGTSNEPHAIFCAECGATRYKAPVREAAPPVEPAPLPVPALLELKGSAAGFSFFWGVATLGGALAASVGEAFGSFVHSFPGTVGSWEFTFRLAAWGVAKGFVYGALVGGLQAWVLSARVPRPGWRAWVFATLGGTVLIFLAGHLLPTRIWLSDNLGGRLAMATLMGVIGGGLVGLLQTRVLSRVVGPGGWSAWWLLSATAQAIGNTAGSLAWEWTFSPRHSGMGTILLAGLSYTIADVGLVALLTGIPLGRMLRRRCGPPKD